MSRLIDVDALKTERGMANQCEKCKHDARLCQMNQDYTRMDICAMLDDAPIVDAIPVAWMAEKALDTSRAPLYRRYARLIIDEWQKEQVEK